MLSENDVVFLLDVDNTLLDNDLSDGDVVFQPRKIQRSGLWNAVQGRVLIDVHKERALDAMQKRFPARHYVTIEDKPQPLAAMKRTLGERLTTVFVHQGHYAAQVSNTVIDPRPDVDIERIADLARRCAHRRCGHEQGANVNKTKELHDLGQSLWLDNPPAR